MVVEIEGVQRIIRRIRMEIREADRVLSNSNDQDFVSILDRVNNIADDSRRLVSLILAETGHWEPQSFSNAIDIATTEMAISSKDGIIIKRIPCLLKDLRKHDQFSSEVVGEIEKFRDAVQILCCNLEEYVIHTELPI